MKTFNVKLVRVFEVQIEAENLEDAQARARQGAININGRVMSIEEANKQEDAETLN